MDRQIDVNVFITENVVEDCAGNKVVPVAIAREAVRLEYGIILTIARGCDNLEEFIQIITSE